MSSSKALAVVRGSGMVVVLAALVGCGGGGGGGGSARMAVRGDSEAHTDFGYTPSTAPRQENYVSAYAAGRYSLAKSLAEAEMRHAGGRAHDRAALIAGLSSHAQGQESDALRLLSPLTSNEDREIAGRAEACLGLIARSQKQHEKAASLLGSAARKLSGDEAARAAMFAGDSYATLGRQTDARTQYAIAASTATGTALKRSLSDRMETGNFTVQLGVFSMRTNAQKAATDMAPTAAMLGLGQPRIIERAETSGKPSYVVQVGHFTTRRSASEAQTRLGGGWPVSLASGQ